MTAFDALSRARYVNLETFRKNGTGVQTPVWVAPDGEDLVIFTNGDSYKVKRLRRNSAVRIAECGKSSALRALRKKYGWQMLLADWGGRIRGSKKNWAVIAVRLNAGA